MMLNRKGRRHSIDLTNIASNIDKLYRTMHSMHANSSSSTTTTAMTLTLPSLSAYLTSASDTTKLTKALQFKQQRSGSTSTATSVAAAAAAATGASTLKFDLLGSELRRMSLVSNRPQQSKLDLVANNKITELVHVAPTPPPPSPLYASSPKQHRLSLLMMRDDAVEPQEPQEPQEPSTTITTTTMTTTSNEISILSISSSIFSSSNEFLLDEDIVWPPATATFDTSGTQRRQHEHHQRSRSSSSTTTATIRSDGDAARVHSASFHIGGDEDDDDDDNYAQLNTDHHNRTLNDDSCCFVVDFDDDNNSPHLAITNTYSSTPNFSSSHDHEIEHDRDQDEPKIKLTQQCDDDLHDEHDNQDGYLTDFNQIYSSLTVPI